MNCHLAPGLPAPAPALLALAGTAAPAAAAPPAVTTARAVPMSRTQNWSIASADGFASGTWCDSNTRVTGTVTHGRADGRCPHVRGRLSNGSCRGSDWAGPKGDSSPVDLSAPGGAHVTGVRMGYIVR